MKFEWPIGFERIPRDEWTQQPVEKLALKYDTVENHGWYKNLDPTVSQLERYLRDGHRIVDYSGGTGIFVDRLLHRIPERSVGIVIVDASAKFLRRALDKLGADERVAFRLIRYLKDQKRLEFVDEVLPSLSFDAIVSTNAIHLYYDLPETLQSWVRVLKPGGRAFINSGNIRNPAAKPGEWIIDETVESIHRTAMDLARRDERYAAYRTVLDDPKRMEQYDALRKKYFLPVRPLDHYLGTLRKAGFASTSVSTATIEARVSEWYDFLSVYHEGVLGWVGGAEKVDGRPAGEAAIQDRLALIRAAMESLFEGKATFDCCWSYIEAVK
jgi:ubiquinone/menaquinone biosynthesis C-methylase UbiE